MVDSRSCYSTSAKPRISVIIPTYNRAQYVGEAVASVLGQTYKAHDIVVVDDGSTDTTSEVLDPYMDEIHYIYQSNQGVAVARNRGLAAATGELFAFLDADDVWLPEKLERQVHCLAQNPGAGLVHTNCLILHGDTGLRSVNPALQALQSYEGRCYSQLFFGNPIWASSVVIRRECLNCVGVFDEQIPRPTVEDYDLWLRVARYFEFAYIPDPLILYRTHATNGSKDIRTLTRYNLYILEKALEADPMLATQVGIRAVRERMAELLFSLGYFAFNELDLREANQYFWRTLRYRPRLYIILLWIATLGPRGTVTRLRQMKRQMGL
jgi:glycosyltransferase involved in cell wall biosynthesis